MNHVGSVHLVATGEQLKFCGDGRSDSPGHSAKYCTYTLMESTSSLIFDLEIIHMSMAENSTTMEREGLRRILKRLGDAPFTIQQVATDRSPMIKTLMRREFSSISHQFDVWHFVKSVVKKLTKATKKKEMAILRKWIPSIANHLWWSASSCNGDATQLRERWLSLLDHITNQHSWTGATKFLKCAHGPLPPGQETQWLAHGSPQHETSQNCLQGFAH